MALMAEIQTRPKPATRPVGGAKVKSRQSPMVGERALIVAVLLRAATDLQDPSPSIRRDALAYFRGPVYQDHLAWLNLPADWLPLALKR